MTVRQDLDTCFSDRIGPGGLDRRLFDAHLAAAAAELARLADERRSGALRLLQVPDEQADLDALKPVAARLAAGATDLVVLGTGGSSLGAQALAALKGHGIPGCPPPPGLRFHAWDNLDGATLAAALARLPLRTTRFLAISKSGTTGETLMQTHAALSALQAAGLELAQHVAFVTEPTDNPMRRLAQRLGAPVLEHDTRVGGRYSVLTMTGVLPAVLLGLDPMALRAGARAALDDSLNAPPERSPAAVGAALALAAAEAGVTELVLWPYADVLAKLAMWWRQLWGESVGKNGQGLSPVVALGPVDQHSQLQLFLAGPGAKLFTVMTLPTRGIGPRLPADLGDPALGWAQGQAIGDLVAAQALATVDTLAKNGRPVRRLALARADEGSFGYLFMLMMLETILAARLSGVDPFDQPAVEEGKILARKYLAEGRG